MDKPKICNIVCAQKSTDFIEKKQQSFIYIFDGKLGRIYKDIEQAISFLLRTGRLTFNDKDEPNLEFDDIPPIEELHVVGSGIFGKPRIPDGIWAFDLFTEFQRQGLVIFLKNKKTA